MIDSMYTEQFLPNKVLLAVVYLLGRNNTRESNAGQGDVGEDVAARRQSAEHRLTKKRRKSERRKSSVSMEGA
jgi:hypothetical protein